MKKIIAVLLVLTVIFTMASCGGNNGEREDIPPEGKFVLGLGVDKNGTIVLDGKPIQAFGVNVYDVFVNKRRVNPDFNVEAAFKGLKEAGISVARVSIGPYSASHFAEYFYSPDSYFEALDAVIASCEKYQIGIFASICWNLSAIVEFLNTYWDSIAEPDSDMVKLAKKYYTDVVSRYKDSPAIWAWEFGNEYNLGADLCFVQTYDHITSENISAYYKEVSSAMRKIDPYRLIVGGDSELSCRPAALRKTHSWTPDTLEDIIDSTSLYAPSPMEAVSSHMYQYGEFGKSEIRDFDTVIKTALEACDTLNKGYYIGEYGPGDFLNNKTGTIEANKEIIDKIHQACLNNNVQIALGWVCVNDFTGEESIRDELYKYWFSEIKRLNEQLRNEGKQDNIASYWSKAENAIYKGDDGIFTKITDHMRGSGNPGTVISISKSTNTSGTWQWSNYDTNCKISLEDAALADGSTGKVFRIVNGDDSAKALLKYTAVTGLKTGQKYKLSFYLKSSGMTKDGISMKLTSPAFFDQEGIKSEKDGEWQYFEFEFEGPLQAKAQNTLTIYLTEQKGDVSLYGIKILDA